MPRLVLRVDVIGVDDVASAGLGSGLVVGRVWSVLGLLRVVRVVRAVPGLRLRRGLRFDREGRVPAGILRDRLLGLPIRVVPEARPLHGLRLRLGDGRGFVRVVRVIEPCPISLRVVIRVVERCAVLVPIVPAAVPVGARAQIVALIGGLRLGFEVLAITVGLVAVVAVVVAVGGAVVRVVAVVAVAVVTAEWGVD